MSVVVRRAVIRCALVLASALPTAAQEIGRGPVFSVVELAFEGPDQRPGDAPARDVELRVRFEHEDGAEAYTIQGFHDGDGRGGASGRVFRVRFCPTRPGLWRIAAVESNAPELRGQLQGRSVTATPAEGRRGFWIADPESPGRRWYMRSDGSHPYIVGNTHYSFLSGRTDDPLAPPHDLAADVARNAGFFKKLRFSLHGDRYPDPSCRPFLDAEGRPTEGGNHSHRPNPAWFRDRADAAVRAAYDRDLIADLILCGPDAPESRSTLRASRNGGDPTPYLRYVAARYGSYPNVWMCLANEYDIQAPRYTDAEVARFAHLLRASLPYPTPVGVHPSDRPRAWPEAFDAAPADLDHRILQRKLRGIAAAADVMGGAGAGRTPEGGAGRMRPRPVVNDELSYQGKGDRHSEADTIEAHVGAFLGGGYGTTGFKPANKRGHYFWGRFDPAEHTAADGLRWLRETIDAEVSFWKMAPDASILDNAGPDARGLAWPGREYVVGTDAPRAGIVARLPPGRWRVRRHDVMARRSATLAEAAEGPFPFDAPDSRAVLFHFARIDDDGARPAP